MALSFSSKYSVMAVEFVSTLIIARLLTPEEIGVFSVGVAIIAFTHALRSFGVPTYLIQEKELTLGRIRAAFTVTLLTGWGIGAALLLLAGPFACFYREAGIRYVISILALNFFLLPFSSVILALLNREMKFGAIYLVQTGSSLARAATSVTLVLLGFGFISLAWGALAGAFASLAILLCYKSNVSFLPTFKECFRVLSFGGRVGFVTLLTDFADEIPCLAAGRTLGFHLVGILSRGLGFVNLFNRSVFSAIRPVVLPNFAAQNRRNRDLKEPYIAATTLILGAAWPALACLSVMAYPAIRILYGSQWDAAVPIAQILFLAAAVDFLSSLNVPLFVGTGKINPYLKQNIIIQPFRVVAVIGASPFGLKAIACAIVLGSCVSFIVKYSFVSRFFDISARDIYVMTIRNALLALITVAPPIVTMQFMEIGPSNYIIPFIIGTTGAGIAWFFGLYMLDHPLGKEILGVAKHLLPQYRC
ncbi:MAG: oligosaccharide flippase family protein [Deltaproteobacteria bacterium]|nr:oligosaccharide flippase family protein [Deltaproteobacteria bacterium]